MGLKLKVKKDKPADPKPEPVVEIVPAQIVTQAPPKESTTVTLTQRRGLPVLTDRGPVNLAAHDAELSKLPRFSCNTCTIGPECPSYQPGMVCAYEKSFAAFPMRDVDSVLTVMREVVERTKIRYRRAVLQEEIVSGGTPTPEVTKLSDQLLSQSKQLLDLARSTENVSITVMGSAPKESLLSKLFGGSSSPAPQLVEKEEVILNPEKKEG